jgi:hypothetical protein
MPKAPKRHHWRIYLIRKKGELLGSVEAPDGKAAIAAAIEKYGITDPERRSAVGVNASQGRKRSVRSSNTSYARHSTTIRCQVIPANVY